MNPLVTLALMLGAVVALDKLTARRNPEDKPFDWNAGCPSCGADLGS